MFGFYGFAQAPFAFISVVYGAIVNVESSDVNTTTATLLDQATLANVESNDTSATIAALIDRATLASTELSDTNIATGNAISGNAGTINILEQSDVSSALASVVDIGTISNPEASDKSSTFGFAYAKGLDGLSLSIKQAFYSIKVLENNNNVNIFSYETTIKIVDGFHSIVILSPQYNLTAV